MVNFNFDSTTYEPMSQEDIPNGWYPAMIVESSMHETASKNGQYIKLKFKIHSGKFKGRHVFTNLNVVNPNEQTMEIAREHLTQISYYTGVRSGTNINALHNIPIDIKVVQEGVNARGYMDYSINGFRALTQPENRPGTPANGATPVQQAPAGFGQPAALAGSTPEQSATPAPTQASDPWAQQQGVSQQPAQTPTQSTGVPAQQNSQSTTPAPPPAWGQ